MLFWNGYYISTSPSPLKLTLCGCIAPSFFGVGVLKFRASRLSVFLQHVFPTPRPDCDALHFTLFTLCLPFKAHFFLLFLLNLVGNLTLTFSCPPAREWQKLESERDLKDPLVFNTPQHLNLCQLADQPVLEQTIMPIILKLINVLLIIL